MIERIFGAVLVCISVCFSADAQFVVTTTEWVEKLDLTGGVPDKLLMTRSAVFYDYRLSAKELKDMQEYFQRTGIDAVVYFELDMVLSGRDAMRTCADYLIRREVTNLFVVEKSDGGYRMSSTPFNGKETFVENTQKAWSLRNPVFVELLKTVYREASSQSRQNLLINPVPETGLKINPILGKRNEFYAIDTKVDPLAVPMTGDSTVDNELGRIFAENYSLKYKLTPAGVNEKDLRRQGFPYVVCVVKTRNAVARELLGYEAKASGTELVSTTYPDAKPESKAIPADAVVYKFYFKHVDSGNVFLGTRWDADETWQEALLNQLRGMKAELRLN